MLNVIEFYDYVSALGIRPNLAFSKLVEQIRETRKSGDGPEIYR